ncbi:MULTISPECIES: ATP-binding protein [Gilliamella]|uniref:ATP-binding protein n=1 Tax=Gilliamella TaxID=1193503 RepID=UPI00080E508A|nr:MULTISPECIES: HAMP domain-containing sensor histidine kinase [Gilliamella]MBI0157091.1 HAMP domain-containing histidine kinase [Gilliamella sp. M0364]MCX8713036.1 HAMP domain-containing histidine kinase [Gilliamella sp. B3468]MCX8752052.1 HAMP domain-containing histidine kinase [Gilliamella sp. B3464]OCG05442.1 histidine kinase [Gilliamella apis]
MINITSKKQIPFKVSARTARLIGRENIATSKGAIIELVKNGYDADSKISIVYFDNKFSVLHSEISPFYYEELKNQIENHYTKLINSISINAHSERLKQEKFEFEQLFSQSYIQNEMGNYVLNNTANEDSIKKLKQYLSILATLYLIDSGEGMTLDIIEKNWMVIGTDNKHENYVTKSGRIKAGAKGIGRFALDRLGNHCEMITVYNPSYHKDLINENEAGYIWRVNWEDFEGSSKTIDNVNAEIFALRDANLKEYIEQLLPKSVIEQLDKNINLQFGTILKISNLRETWNDYYVDQVYADLEALVPPEETGGFQIYLFSSLTPDKYGLIPSVLCDDFDYKIIAKADNSQNIKIKIIRNEYDVDRIPPDFFNRKNLTKYPYRLEDFQKGEWELQKTFSQLMPGYEDVDKDGIFKLIGQFEFSFYFLKKQKSPDAEKFFHKESSLGFRKNWLAKFGGIKLFRDNFRVRPYGEVKDVAFDWLGLGMRKAASPAGIGKKNGGYRVEPDNITGAISISRLANIDFEDKSSREGLQENKTFLIFKQLIISLINIFEEDRAYIAREMVDYNNEKYSEQRTREEAEKIAQRIYEESKKSQKNDNPNMADDSPDQKEKFILAELNAKKDDEIERLREEQKLLRGMASGGIVLAAFTHELSHLSNQLESRVNKIKKLLLDKIPENDYKNEEERKNPYILLERMKSQDLKMHNWLNFSLGAARKDKRKRNQLYLSRYFQEFKNDWATVLNERSIDLDIKDIANINLRMFEIDMDSIFNNLVVNSIDAFTKSKKSRDRVIIIKAKETLKEICIVYQDNGPGLSKDIFKHEDIFKPLFTTKRNPDSGEEIGTGLGMWIIKSVIEENDGSVKLLYPNEGFSLEVKLPVKYKR